jgi:hypothetical protein
VVLLVDDIVAALDVVFLPLGLVLFKNCSVEIEDVDTLPGLHSP